MNKFSVVGEPGTDGISKQGISEFKLEGTADFNQSKKITFVYALMVVIQLGGAAAIAVVNKNLFTMIPVLFGIVGSSFLFFVYGARVSAVQSGRIVIAGYLIFYIWNLFESGFTPQLGYWMLFFAAFIMSVDILNEGMYWFLAFLTPMLGYAVLQFIDGQPIFGSGSSATGFYGSIAAMFILLKITQSRIDHIYQKMFGLSESHKSTSAELKAVLDSLDKGVVATSKEGIINHVNTDAQSIIGDSDENILGEHISTQLTLKRNGAVVRSFDHPAVLTIANKKRYVSNSGIYSVRSSGVDLPIEFATSPVLREGVITGSMMMIKVLDRT